MRQHLSKHGQMSKKKKKKTRCVCETPYPCKRTIFEKALFIRVLRLRVKNLP